MRLVAGDHAAELGEGGREHAGKARVVVVVGVGDRELAVAVLPGERGEGSSLVGVGGRDPEHEVVVVEVRDRGRGSRVSESITTPAGMVTDWAMPLVAPSSWGR